MLADSQTGKQFIGSKQQLGLPDIFVTKILPLDNGDYLLGFNGGGIVKSTKSLNLIDRKSAETKFNKDKIFSVAQNDFPQFPSKIKPPTIDELKQMQTQIKNLKKPLPKIYATNYGEDWKTQGDWVGHYGRLAALLCGTIAPMDHFYSNLTYVDINGFIGINAKRDDTIRRWVNDIYTDNPKTLYSPLNGYRRQAEWDDHGETYPITQDGPGMWSFIKIEPKGTFLVDMYFFNKDGHNGNNRLRDYTIEVYNTTENWKNFNDRHKLAILGEKFVRENKPLLKTRVRDFWGGIHKSFYVKGETNYLVRINRNYSFNTIVSSFTVDRISGNLMVTEKNGLLPGTMSIIKYSPIEIPDEFISPLAVEAAELWNKTNEVQDRLNGYTLQRRMRITALRAAIEASPKDTPIEHYDVALEKTLRWRLNQWNPEMRKEFQETMEKAWKKLGKMSPDYIRYQEEQLKKRKDGTWKSQWKEIMKE
jgi:hypothetical protein